MNEPENMQEKAAELAQELAAETAEQAPDPMAELAQENAKLKDQLLRAMADVENIRRRMVKEKEEAHKFAIGKFAKDLIAVAENLARAESAFSEELLAEYTALTSLKEGVTLTQNELQRVFAAHGLRKISPLGEVFDHNMHEALAQVPHADAAPGTVIEVMQEGYRLNDRLLQPARVAVTKEQS